MGLIEVVKMDFGRSGKPQSNASTCMYSFSRLSLRSHDHSLALSIFEYDSIELCEIDGSTFVYIDTVEPLLVTLVVPFLCWIGLPKKFLQK